MSAPMGSQNLDSSLTHFVGHLTNQDTYGDPEIWDNALASEDDVKF